MCRHTDRAPPVENTFVLIKQLSLLKHQMRRLSEISALSMLYATTFQRLLSYDLTLMPSNKVLIKMRCIVLALLYRLYNMRNVVPSQ